jgi:hypothetical protein
MGFAGWQALGVAGMHDFAENGRFPLLKSLFQDPPQKWASTLKSLISES